MTRLPNRWRRRAKWVAGIGLIIAIGLLLGIPVGASFLITNSRFSFPESGVSNPSRMGLDVENVAFQAEDGIRIAARWNRGDTSMPGIVFAHGLNRSGAELLDRAIEASDRGYGVLLIDLRNHGASDPAFTTLGVHESRDVCAAADFIEQHDAGREIAVWGVSLGASSALLAAARCPEMIRAAVADSPFLSIEETVGHHLTLLTGLPAFPVADLIVAITAYRMEFEPGDGDVEAAVRARPNLPIQFIAGGADVRMPPEIARRLRAASVDPRSALVEVPDAAHGRAFETAPDVYLSTVFAFLDRVFPRAGG